MSTVLVFSPRPWTKRLGDIGVFVTAVLVSIILFWISIGALIDALNAEEPSEDAWVATSGSMLFSMFFGWVAWKSRLTALPFEFVADASGRECGYQWGARRAQWVRLTGISTLRGEVQWVSVRRYEGRWTWTLYAMEPGSRKKREVFCSTKNETDQDVAISECREMLVVLSEHFSIPAELHSVKGEIGLYGER